MIHFDIKYWFKNDHKILVVPGWRNIPVPGHMVPKAIIITCIFFLFLVHVHEDLCQQPENYENCIFFFEAVIRFILAIFISVAVNSC